MAWVGNMEEKVKDEVLDVGRSQIMKDIWTIRNLEVFKMQWKLTWPDALFLKYPSGYYMENSLGESEVQVRRLATKLLQ